MSNEQTIIQFKRYKATGGSTENRLQYGEPFFDEKSGFLYVGVRGDKTLSEMRSGGEYYKRINAQNPIVTSDINANAITAEKIAQNSILTNHIYNGAVTTPKIADGAITNDKIADNTITYNKLNLRDGDIPLSKVSVGTGSIDASKIGGKLSVNNLPDDYTAPKAIRDVTNADITSYAARLSIENNSHLVLRNRLAFLGKDAESKLNVISAKEMADFVKPYLNLKNPTLGELSGTISWSQIVGAPSILNLSSSIGNATQPVYYDAKAKMFGLCEPMGLIRLGDVVSVGDGETYKSSLDGVAFRAESSMWVVAFASVKVKDSKGNVFWYSGTGFTNTSYSSTCVLLDLSISGDYDIVINLKRQNNQFHISASAKTWTISQLKCKVYKLL